MSTWWKDFKVLFVVDGVVAAVAFAAMALLSDRPFDESLVFGLASGSFVGGIVGLALWGSRLPVNRRR